MKDKSKIRLEDQNTNIFSSNQEKANKEENSQLC